MSGYKRSAFCVPRRQADETFASNKTAATSRAVPSSGSIKSTHHIPKSPLCSSSVPNVKPESKNGTDEIAHAAYKVLYLARSTKKRSNKRGWLDGYMSCVLSGTGWDVELFGEDGKPVSKKHIRTPVPLDEEFQVGNWDVEVDAQISHSALVSGSAYLQGASSLVPCGLKATSASSPAMVQTDPSQSVAAQRPAGVRLGPNAATLRKATADSAPPGAFMLHEAEGGARPVYVDGYLAKHLRPHQQQGVLFLYNGAPATHRSAYYGGILADAMGLGKTLQVLAAAWTLLQRGSPKGQPLVRKMLVVAPSSLIKNWGNEIKKWLGIGVEYVVLLPGKEAAGQVIAFKNGNRWKIMCASYENIRKHCDTLQGSIDLLVCDEGHRLKSAGGNSTMTALLALKCPRRLILTGTPVQNNLKEFFAMMNFVNPGLLGTQATFQRVFAQPIEASRESNAAAAAVALGQARMRELSRVIAPFQLRRTADINRKYLPPCLKYVVFCRPTTAQLKSYERVLRDESCLDRLLTTHTPDGTQVLSLIGKLRQACNHPALAALPVEEGDEACTSPAASTPSNCNPALSSKLLCLQLMLPEICALGEKTVVVSTSTKMLDMAQHLCRAASLKTSRIDGSTAAQARQELVNVFNAPGSDMSVFLLSTRAGGAGLNLIGGSRLFLLDSDWNPAMDQQAMARIWRDGQKRTCHIYRLLVTGLIDEKMFQRQLYKEDLTGFVGEGAKGTKGQKAGKSGTFSQEELRKLFEMNVKTDCDTRDMLAACDSAVAANWVDCSATVKDAPLQTAVAAGVVSFVQLQAATDESASRGDHADGATPACASTCPGGETTSSGPTLQTAEREESLLGSQGIALPNPDAALWDESDENDDSKLPEGRTDLKRARQGVALDSDSGDDWDGPFAGGLHGIDDLDVDPA